MNSRWFKEERALPNNERDERIQETKAVLLHSTLMVEKLQRIIDEELEEAYTNEENICDPNYRDRATFNAGARKVLRKLKKLLDLKGA